MDKLQIIEDITDWLDETKRDESFVANEDEILVALRNGISTAKVARSAVVSRAMKVAPEDIIRPNKVLLNVGAQTDVIAKAHTAKRKTTVKNGAEYNINELVGHVYLKPEKSDDESEEIEEPETVPDYGPSFVDVKDGRALEWSIRYLEQTITGHIWNRLLIINENGGDVKNEADKLKQAIDEMVEKIA